VRHISIRVDEGLLSIVDGLVDASGATPEVPVLSRSEVLRLLLDSASDDLAEGDLDADAIADDVDPETLAELIPDHRRAKYLREEAKEESWLVDMREGFEGRVRDQLEERFSGDYDPDGIEEFAETFVEEARIYWRVIDDDPERYRDAVAFVEERVEQYRETYKSSTYDPNAEFLSGFSGVAEGIIEEDVEEVEEEVRAIAETRYREGTPDSSALAESIALVYDLDEDAVLDIVEQVRRESVVRDQSRRSDVDPSETPRIEDDGVAHDAHSRLPDHSDREEQDAREVDAETAEWLDAEEVETDGGRDS
jgi:hypothetical protein